MPRILCGSYPRKESHLFLLHPVRGRGKEEKKKEETKVIEINAETLKKMRLKKKKEKIMERK